MDRYYVAREQRSYWHITSIQTWLQGNQHPKLFLLFLLTSWQVSFQLSPFLFPLCQHELFAHQTVRTASILRLTFAAHADEASLSPFSFHLSPLPPIPLASQVVLVKFLKKKQKSVAFFLKPLSLHNIKHQRTAKHNQYHIKTEKNEHTWEPQDTTYNNIANRQELQHAEVACLTCTPARTCTHNTWFYNIPHNVSTDTPCLMETFVVILSRWLWAKLKTERWKLKTERWKMKDERAKMKDES